MASSSNAGTETPKSLQPLVDRLVNTWPDQLRTETADHKAKSFLEARTTDDGTNQQRRPVLNGHWVPVTPAGLPAPQLLLHSSSTAELLELSEDMMTSDDDMINWLSGNLILKQSPWATAYALSIMGTRYTNNCPYGTGDGYGDGRAVSIGELSTTNAGNFELQLKGSGPTPYCRGADGRAVLRSSIREFLAQEANWHLGIDTTRGLSLIMSKTATTQRPWYREAAGDDPLASLGISSSSRELPSLDDPRLAQYSLAQRRQILSQLRHEKSDPNVMITETLAIACRVSKSFVRIGHIDLFARRVERVMRDDGSYDTERLEWKEYEAMVWHAAFREFKETAYDPFFEKKDLKSAAKVIIEESAQGIAKMVAGWLRVGFAQGNFNADNCLVAGRT